MIINLTFDSRNLRFRGILFRLIFFYISVTLDVSRASQCYSHPQSHQSLLAIGALALGGNQFILGLRFLLPRTSISKLVLAQHLSD